MRREPESCATHVVKIFGERNSGTNLLEEIIERNFRVDLLVGVVTRLAPTEADKDAFFDETERQNLGWKHAAAPPAAVVEATDVRFVTITKHPFAWLLSLYRRPYHYDGVVPDTFAAFIRAPWRCRRRDRVPDQPNPVALWNAKNASYLGLPRDRTLNLRYEDYLDAPTAFVDRIGAALAIPTVDGITRVVTADTKGADQTLGDYAARYQPEAILRQIDPADVEFITAELDPTVMAGLGYEPFGGA